MANIVNGTSMQLFITTGETNKSIAASTSCKLGVSMETRKIRSKDDGKWANSAEGMLSWSVDSENLYTADVLGISATTYKELLQLYMDRTPITVSIGGVAMENTIPITRGTSFISGTARITKLDINFPDNDNASYSISLEGTGALTNTL